MKKFSDKMLKKLLAFYANQNKATKIEIHVMQKETIRKIKNYKKQNNESTSENDGELFYNAFTDAIYQIYKIHNTNKLKSSDNLIKATEIRIMSIKTDKQNKSVVRDKIIDCLMPLIIKLRNEHLSWQNISNYIAKYHKKKISRTYLHAVYKMHEKSE